MWFKTDPGPCPVDDAPHTTCCAPGTTTDGEIVAGAITPAIAVTVPGLPTATAPPVTPADAPAAAETTFTTKSRHRWTRVRPAPGA